jgi:hypothetical protein
MKTEEPSDEVALSEPHPIHPRRRLPTRAIRLQERTRPKNLLSRLLPYGPPNQTPVEKRSALDWTTDELIAFLKTSGIVH